MAQKVEQIKESTKEQKSFTEKFKENPWVLATIILGIVSVILIFVAFKGSITGYTISEEEASEKLVSYLNTLVSDGQVNYVSSKDFGSLYEIKVSYQGQIIPVYITKDGEYWTPTLTSLKPLPQTNQQTTQKEIPKTDKPIVEAFVFSYCPYGLQFEKALLPVYKILKTKADIRIVAVGAMHGQYEETESIRQLCIQKEYGKDKLFDYLEKFLGKTEIGNCRGNENCSNTLVEQIMSELSINKTRINDCMANEGRRLYEQDTLRAQELGISGSPTFVVNSVEVPVSRNPNAIKEAICSAFTQEPSECNQTLSSENASPWFGYSTTSSSSTSSCG